MPLLTCPDCDKKFSDSADSCPNCGYKLSPENLTRAYKNENRLKRNRNIVVAGFVFLFVFVYWLGWLKEKNSESVSQKTSITEDELSTTISKFGTPDLDDSTQHDSPRPRFVTRWIIYKQENVEFLFVPEDKSAQSPKWKFLDVVDAKTKKPISADEATRRLAKRTK